MRSPYDTRVVRTVRASPLCRVHFDGNSYSVPPAVAGAALTLKATATEVVIYAGAEEVARHARNEGKGHDVVDPAHVKALLDAKRRGDRGALVHQFAALGPVADAYLKGLVTSELALYRHLRRILALVERFGREEVLAAIAHAQGFRTACVFFQMICWWRRPASPNRSYVTARTGWPCLAEPRVDLIARALTVFPAQSVSVPTPAGFPSGTLETTP